MTMLVNGQGVLNPKHELSPKLFLTGKLDQALWR